MNAVEANQSFNTLYNQMSGIYHAIVKQYKMSECQFWILYALTVEEKPLSQAELIRYLIAPKQTIHSAIHKMISEEYITLKEISGTKKYYMLTKKGNELSSHTVKKVILDEIHVFDAFTEEERKTFISLLTKYIQQMERTSL